MEYKKMNNNIEIPVIGYGVYQTPRNLTAKLVEQAIRSGYNHIDTAQNYANEHEVGQAIKSLDINREDIFVTTKIQTTGYDSTIKSIGESLEQFGYDYFDLILIHWPNMDNIGTYKALEDMYNNGKVRSIGLSNFNTRQCNEILENCKIKPAVNQIETHILWQQKRLHDYLNKKDMLHMAWSPFASGYMNIFEDETLKVIAEKYKKTVGQIMLKYLLQKDIIVIPKSTNINRMKENIDLFNFTLSKEDLSTISKLDQRKSYCNWPSTMREESMY